MDGGVCTFSLLHTIPPTLPSHSVVSIVSLVQVGLLLSSCVVTRGEEDA